MSAGPAGDATKKKKRVARASLVAALSAASLSPAVVAAVDGFHRPSGASIATPGRGLTPSVPASAALRGVTPLAGQDSATRDQQAIDYFFTAGYDPGDAAQLAAYWGYDDPLSAKIAMGRFLLGWADYPDPAPIDPDGAVGRAAIEAFLEVYDADYATQLAEHWGYDDPITAKIVKGRVRLGEIEFPPPAGYTPADAIALQATTAYAEAGFTYDDAVELAGFWGYEDPVTAKIVKGKFLLGIIDDLPPVDHGEPPVADPTHALADSALSAFFEAGYDYDDAVALAEYWGHGDPLAAKLSKGLFLLGYIGFPPPADGPAVGTPAGPPATGTPAEPRIAGTPAAGVFVDPWVGP